jgi:hypothetical protein
MLHEKRFAVPCVPEIEEVPRYEAWPRVEELDFFLTQFLYSWLILSSFINLCYVKKLVNSCLS